MLGRSSQVNFKDKVARSGSKLRDSATDMEEDAYVGAIGVFDGVRDGVSSYMDGLYKDGGISEMNESELIFGSVSKESVVSNNSNVGIKSNGVNDPSFAGNVSINGNGLGSSGSSFIPEMPVPFKDNPILNPNANVNQNSKGNSVKMNEVKGPGMFKIIGNGSLLNKGVGLVSNFALGGQSKEACSGLSNNGGLKQSMSFASTVAKSFGGFGNNKLKFVSTTLNEEGREVAIMDSVLEEGVQKWSMNCVIENGPWMVENKPLFVHKWEPGLCLVEVDATKGLVDTVEIWYKSLGKSMMLNVEYVWKPLLCEHCKTFGHISRLCSKAQVNVDKKNVDYRRGNRSFANSYQQYSVNGYSGRGNMGYKVRGGANNRDRSNVVDVRIKESSVKYVPVKSNDKNMNVDECLVADEVVKTSSSAGVGVSSVKSNSKKELGNFGRNDKSSGGKAKGSIVKDDISVNNRFDALNKDNYVEVSDVWEDVRARITTACISGLPIVEEELIEVMESLHNRIVHLNKNLYENARANALELVKETDEAMGVKSNNSLYTKLYDQSCREDLMKVEELQWERRMDEVDLFMLSKMPLMDDFKEICTEDMVDYFLERCEEIKNDAKNGHYADDSGFDNMEEVGEDVSGSASFMAQNEVVSDIDGSMAQMQGGLAAHPSNLQ
ncbi:hypothetical protein Tco_1501070 [Tanacetum coccineum]